MISQKTAARIWNAYREIETAEKLLAVMEKEARPDNMDAPTIRDAFGQTRHLQLGIPSGANSHKLFDVHPGLAASVIRAHIARKRTDLAEANESARIELDTCSPEQELGL